VHWVTHTRLPSPSVLERGGGSVLNSRCCLPPPIRRGQSWEGTSDQARRVTVKVRLIQNCRLRGNGLSTALPGLLMTLGLNSDGVGKGTFVQGKRGGEKWSPGHYGLVKNPGLLRGPATITLGIPTMEKRRLLEQKAVVGYAVGSISGRSRGLTLPRMATGRNLERTDRAHCTR